MIIFAKQNKVDQELRQILKVRLTLKKTKGICKQIPFLITYALPQLRGSQKVTFTPQI